MNNESSIPGTQSTSTSTTDDPQRSPGRTKLADLGFTLQGTLSSIIDEIRATGLESDLSRLIEAKDALDRYVDHCLNKVQLPNGTQSAATGVVDEPQAPKVRKDFGQVEVWIRRADGAKVFVCEMDLAAFEAATHGEVWTRLSDGESVYMDPAELHAYYSVDTYGWGASLDGVATLDQANGASELKGAVE